MTVDVLPTFHPTPAPASRAEPAITATREAGLTILRADVPQIGRRVLYVNSYGMALAYRLWAAGELAPGFQAFVMGAYQNRPPIEGEEREPDTDLEQGYLRYTAPGKARLMVEAGRMVTPVGDFSPRYLPDQNPLVGTPSDYSVTYPEGVKVVGWVKRFDMMASAVNRPLNADWYALPTGKAMRPMLSAGYTPVCAPAIPTDPAGTRVLGTARRGAAIAGSSMPR